MWFSFPATVQMARENRNRCINHTCTVIPTLYANIMTYQQFTQLDMQGLSLIMYSEFAHTLLPILKTLAKRCSVNNTHRKQMIAHIA